ncbi:hypothetical protein [Pseudopedobacter sp.]|uniref:hypothetical protein n=1 Tax=Pseudopedobacter sp. TaxID=1936787 RepID=UPI003340CC76
MTQHSNSKSKAPKGKPSDSQRGGDGLKDVTLNEETNETLENRYLDNEGQPDDVINLRHANRNVNKGREDQGENTNSI